VDQIEAGGLDYLAQRGCADEAAESGLVSPRQRVVELAWGTDGDVSE
jgi:hypothetical protein